jgi:PilZ domain
METPVGLLTERRGSARRWLSAEGRSAQVRIRSGHPAVVLNISAGGVLVESESRLPPGTTIEMIFEEPDKRVSVKGRVLRSAVTRVLRNGVSYQVAVAFDRHLASAPDSAAGYCIPPPHNRTTALFRADATQAMSTRGSDHVG